MWEQCDANLSWFNTGNFAKKENVLRIFDAFFLQNCLCWILSGTLTIIFDVLEEIIGKIIKSWHIGICSIIHKIIDIGRRLPQIIGGFRELSATLLISKMTGELSKIYCYRKKWLLPTPTWGYWGTIKGLEPLGGLSPSSLSGNM